ncbi:MAG: type IX secretion system plug protein domain-containing protein, partial [Flavobacteriales bacterium]
MDQPRKTMPRFAPCWKPSDLESGQYIRGFATNQISDIQYSFNTLTNYIHYRFNYPTDISQPTLSGNYALVIFSGSDLSDRSTWVLSLRMVVYELQTTIRSNVHASSIIADRYTHQEIDFDLAHKGFSINDPMNDIHALIIQNFDWKRTSEFLKPIFIQPDVLTFDYFSGENTFEGCAEWRFFEMKDLRYQSSQVEHIAQLDDGYHVYLRPCVPEGKRAYSSWQDLNGNFLVKNDQGGDDQIEADYTWVHFVLTMPEISDAGVFIEGA